MINSVSPNWGGARNYACRISHSLTHQQSCTLIDACYRAIEISVPFNRFITINWSLLGINANNGGFATSKFFQLARDWFRARGYRWAWIYVREAGSKKKNKIRVPNFTNNHLHFLAHIPKEISKDFSKQIRIWIKAIGGCKYKKGVLKTKTIGDNLDCFERYFNHYRLNLNKVLFGYLLKGATRETAHTFGFKKFEIGGAIIGKRCGHSLNLSNGN